MSNAVKAKSWPVGGLEPHRTTHGGPPFCTELPVAASQTIAIGDPVILSSGEVAIATASSGLLYGVATEAVTTTAGDEKTPIKVAVGGLAAGNIFRVQQKASTASSALVVGTAYDLVGSTGAFYIDSGNVDEKVLVVIDHVSGDDTSDTTDPGRVEVVIARSSFDQGEDAEA